MRVVRCVLTISPHSMNLQMATIQAFVIRSQSVTLGPQHVDTQLVCHNLGCVLDRLGRGHKALGLLEQAHKVWPGKCGINIREYEASSLLNQTSVMCPKVF